MHKPNKIVLPAPVDDARRKWCCW